MQFLIFVEIFIVKKFIFVMCLFVSSSSFAATEFDQSCIQASGMQQTSKIKKYFVDGTEQNRGIYVQGELGKYWVIDSSLPSDIYIELKRTIKTAFLLESDVVMCTSTTGEPNRIWSIQLNNPRVRITPQNLQE